VSSSPHRLAHTNEKHSSESSGTRGAGIMQRVATPRFASTREREGVQRGVNISERRRLTTERAQPPRTRRRARAGAPRPRHETTRESRATAPRRAAARRHGQPSSSATKRGPLHRASTSNAIGNEERVKRHETTTRETPRRSATDARRLHLHRDYARLDDADRPAKPSLQRAHAETRRWSDCTRPQDVAASSVTLDHDRRRGARDAAKR